MNEAELKAAKKLAIKAIEEYINNHEYELERLIITPMTSGYLILDTFKGQLIKEVYR